MNKNRKALIGVAAIAGAVIVIVVATSVFLEAEEAEEITTQQAQSIVAQNPGEVFEVIREVMDECVSEALFFANREDIGDILLYEDFLLNICTDSKDELNSFISSKGFAENITFVIDTSLQEVMTINVSAQLSSVAGTVSQDFISSDAIYVCVPQTEAVDPECITDSANLMDFNKSPTEPTTDCELHFTILDESLDYLQMPVMIGFGLTPPPLEVGEPPPYTVKFITALDPLANDKVNDVRLNLCTLEANFSNTGKILNFTLDTATCLERHTVINDTGDDAQCEAQNSSHFRFLSLHLQVEHPEDISVTHCRIENLTDCFPVLGVGK
ncbi:TPA: hypothetical protein H1008_03110 [archaeon]|nr:hypothetical protein [Candidatus Undinarchaeales archaeon SRR5007147.bin71]